MARGKAIRVYVQLLHVRISGRVPFDMLRYDQCTPDTGEDAAKLASLDRYEGIERVRGPIEVTLRRYTLVNDAPTVGRWKSFGCEILKWETR